MSQFADSRYISQFLMLCILVCATASHSKAQSLITVDASHFSSPDQSSFHGGTSTSPVGQSIGLNSQYLTLDGKPWLPVMGEFHYTRVPESEWEEEILKAKAAGVNILATYVIWIHHQEVEGKFDWAGRRDLRHFVQLCGKHGIYVYVRIGPWAHAEARNGGFPDWLLKKAPHSRENDPTYLGYVAKYYDQIGEQLRGELWKDGGPVIGVQLENEYAYRGPEAGDAHILELKKLAQAAGLDVPLYSVTGWDGAVVPKGAVIAVFGGYPDMPWDGSISDLPPQEVYVFRFGSRVTGNMGMIGMKNDNSAAETYDFPFMTAEMGGGVQDTYHRRPVVQPDDVAAMVPVMLGSGVNLYGSYMFQGGENPDGILTTLQESQRTGYATDVPVKSYDFQAPLGEFGQERETLRKLKVYDYFMNDFGATLAPMETYAPSVLPSSTQDLSVPRISVRTDGQSGFLFFNNYVRNEKMPARVGFQVSIELPHENLKVPAQPITLPSGSYGLWPFNMRIAGAMLQYATAQPFTRLDSTNGTIVYFVATRGVLPEFVWEDTPGISITASHAKAHHEGKLTIIDSIEPSLAPVITLQEGHGKCVHIVLLDQDRAENLWRVRFDHSSHLVLTHDQFWNDGSQVHLDRNGDPHFEFVVTPQLKKAPSASVALHGTDEPWSSSFSATLLKANSEFTMTQTAKDGQVPPVPIGPAVSWRKGVAMAPDEAAFSDAAQWSIQIPEQDWHGVKDFFLRVDYDGDLARLSADRKLLDDNFYNGEPWEIGLRRFRASVDESPITLSILSRRKDAPIFLERPFREEGEGQVMKLNHVQLIPQYELSFDLPRTP